MLVEHRGIKPTVDPTSFIAPTAAVVGRVRIGRHARVMYGAVVDSEGSRVEVGDYAVVCENAVLRATAVGKVERPVLVADHVFVSPHATLLGCEVERASYIATGVTVLHGAQIGTGGVVAVGALVHAGTVVPAGFFVPPNMIAVGDPVRLYRPDDPGLPEAIRLVGFSREAFGVEADWNDRVRRYTEVTEVRAREFEAHLHDRILDPTKAG